MDHKSLGAHTSLGARRSRHMSLGAYMNAHTITHDPLYELRRTYKDTFKFGSTYKRTYKCLYVRSFALGSYMVAATESPHQCNLGSANQTKPEFVGSVCDVHINP